MAIDLATATSTTTSETIFFGNDNPNPNHARQTPITKTMKLESVQVVTNGSGGIIPSATSPIGNGHLASHHHHHKGFLEQIRRNLTFGSVNNLQLTKLWLFRQANRGQSWAAAKANRQNNSTLPNPHLPTTKLDSNGNDFSIHNGSTVKPPVSNGVVSSNIAIEHSNGRVPNGTQTKPSETRFARCI